MCRTAMAQGEEQTINEVRGIAAAHGVKYWNREVKRMIDDDVSGFLHSGALPLPQESNV